jgi:hypothetical protein
MNVPEGRTSVVNSGTLYGTIADVHSGLIFTMANAGLA